MSLLVLPSAVIGLMMSPCTVSSGSILYPPTSNCWGFQCTSGVATLKIKKFQLEVPAACTDRCCNNITVETSGSETITLCDGAMGSHSVTTTSLKFSLKSTTTKPTGSVSIDLSCTSNGVPAPSGLVLGGLECESQVDYSICPKSMSGYCLQGLCTAVGCTNTADCPDSPLSCQLTCQDGFCTGKPGCTIAPTAVPTAAPTPSPTAAPSQTPFPTTELPSTAIPTTSPPLTTSVPRDSGNRDNDTTSFVPTPFYLDEDFASVRGTGTTNGIRNTDSATGEDTDLQNDRNGTLPLPDSSESRKGDEKSSDGGYGTLRIAMGAIILMFVLGGVAMALRTWHKNMVPKNTIRNHNLFETSHLWQQRLESQRADQQTV
eukprot:TRINITY_DN21229_c0_g1_i1.p1 TRINITY_DN21229_c0_g1~~TRINITY_DN21229_c0_g1_i1.p1  ORF type:complete len:374 (+),score=57.28 TRINITY_DN21229_c0_g1_i1:44-1165(+)